MVLKELLFYEFGAESIKLSVINIIYAVVLVVIGIILGNVIKRIMNRFKEEMEKTLKHSFFVLLLSVIQWSIYILFVNFALQILRIPILTSWLTSILIVIPALVGSLLLIFSGFAIASYLKDLIDESKILNYQLLENITFYFIIYVFLVFALKTALISIDTKTVNMLVIVFTAVISIAVAFVVSYKSIRRRK